jgi:hypothetical protein
MELGNITVKFPFCSLFGFAIRCYCRFRAVILSLLCLCCNISCQILASMITYWNNCVITDNANSGAVSNGEDSGDTHMDVSGGHGDESHSSSTRHSGESGR